MDRGVAQRNIANFRDLLKTDIDETKRQMITRLLAEEEARLAAIPDKKK